MADSEVVIKLTPELDEKALTASIKEIEAHIAKLEKLLNRKNSSVSKRSGRLQELEQYQAKLADTKRQLEALNEVDNLKDYKQQERKLSNRVNGLRIRDDLTDAQKKDLEHQSAKLDEIRKKIEAIEAIKKARNDAIAAQKAEEERIEQEKILEAEKARKAEEQKIAEEQQRIEAEKAKALEEERIAQEKIAEEQHKQKEEAEAIEKKRQEERNIANTLYTLYRREENIKKQIKRLEEKPRTTYTEKDSANLRGLNAELEKTRARINELRDLQTKGVGGGIVPDVWDMGEKVPYDNLYDVDDASVEAVADIAENAESAGEAVNTLNENIDTTTESLSELPNVSSEAFEAASDDLGDLALELQQETERLEKMKAVYENWKVDPNVSQQSLEDLAEDIAKTETHIAQLQEKIGAVKEDVEKSERSIGNFISSIRNVFHKNKDVEVVDDALLEKIRTLEARIEKIKARINSLNEMPRTNFTLKMQEELKELEDELEKTRKARDKLLIEHPDATAILELDREIDILIKKIAKIEETPATDFTDKMQEKLKAYEAELDEAIARKNELVNGQANTGGFFKTVFSEMFNAVGQLGKFALGGLITLVGKGLTGAFGLLGKIATSVFNKITKSGHKTNKTIRTLILGILGARSAYFAIRKATQAYLSTNEQLQAKLNGVWAAMGELIGPVIERLINLFIYLFGWINAIVRALTGIDMAARANAKSLSKQASATKEAGNQLAKFDEMNKLSDPSSSGGGNSDVGTSLTIPEIDIGSIDNIGKTIAERINGLINTLPWTEWGKKISDGIIYVLTQINDFLDTVEWYTFGQKMAEFITSIDWVQIIELLSRSFGGVIGALAGFLSGLLEGVWNTIKEHFKHYIDWAVAVIPDDTSTIGEQIIVGVLMGILAGLRNIVVWIWEHIFKPIWEGIRAAFEIGSPSKKMEEIGLYIVEGLKNGVAGVWDAIKQFFIDLPKNIKSFFEGLPQWFAILWQAIKDALAAKWDSMKQNARDAWEGIKEIFSPVTTWFKDKFGEAWAKVKKIFAEDDGSFTFDSIKEGVENVFKKIVNSLIRGLNRVIAIPFNKLNSILNWIKDLSFLGISPFRSLWSYNPVAVPQIPYLAKGAVIPPNKEFMAILGDQRSGVNIEAPLDTIVEAFRQAQGEVQPTPVYLTLDGKVVAKSVIKWEKKLNFGFNG